MHCQFATFHLECRLRLKFLNLNAYLPNLKKLQTLKLLIEYV